MKPNFSVVMIVKNGEKTLPRLFDSLKGFIDAGGEICVLDTGSTDNSYRTCTSYGCRVEQEDKFLNRVTKSLADQVNEKFGEEIIKEGDMFFAFGNARNEAHKMASKDMILSLDSDEIVTAMDIEKINILIDEGNVRFEHMQVYTHDREGGDDIKFIHSKFYDRRFFGWQNLVHEMLIGNGPKQRLSESELKIEHFQDQDKKRSMYMTGLAIDCFLHPDNDRNCHYFARELFYAGKYDAALKEFERHLAMTLPPKDYDTTPTHMESMLFIGNIYAFKGQLDKELEWYDKARKLDPSHRNVVVRFAHFYKWHQNKAKCLDYAMQAKSFPFDEKYGVSEKHFYDEVDELISWSIS
jgi:glycosyltransferase involved in cell wall biosynthesis